MSSESERPDTDLDRILEGMRSLAPDASTEAAAAERVRAMISRGGEPLPLAGAARSANTHQIVGCGGPDGYQDLIPAFLSGELAPARALLLEQHTHECVACRKAIMAARSGVTLRPARLPGLAGVGADARGAVRRLSFSRLAAAAAVAVALVGFGAWLTFGPGGRGVAQEARLRDVQGEVLLVGNAAGARSAAVAPIAMEPSPARGVPTARVLAPGETIRTARGGSAFVELADGSLIEMRERSELSLGARADGTVIQLARGDVIVQAAKQPRGHLYVATEDALVSVVGTVFAVDSGLGGSRVSVLEGEVHVSSGGTTQVLRSGDQVGTRGGIEATPLESEISWSRNLDAHIALLRELADLRRDLDAAVPPLPARHSTRLLDAAPEGTVVYAAIPNLSEGIGEARRMIDERIRTNETLRVWWQENMTRGDRSLLEEVVSRVQALGEQIGDEIVVTASLDENGQFGGLLVIAELENPAGFRRLIDRELRKFNARLGEDQGHSPVLRLLPEDLNAAVPSPGESLLLWTHGGLLAASNSLERLRAFSGAADPGSANPFLAQPFHDRLAESYGDGVELLVGVDLHSILARSGELGSAGDRAALLQSGLLDMSHLIIERRGEGHGEEGRTTDTAILAFDHPRQGIASWLAAPAPMGGLQFISPDASIVASTVVKEPVALVDDLFAMVRADVTNFEERLAEFEADAGVSVREDLAASIGGEFTIALDGPVLPTPSWKLVAEVYDSARFQSALERLVARFNGTLDRHAALNAEGAGPVTHLVVEREEAGGRSWFTLRAGTSSIAAHYTFEDGYLVSGPSRVLVERALALRGTRTTFASSPKLAALLPRKGRVDFSALLYQDLGSLAGSLGDRIRGFAGLGGLIGDGAGGDMSPEQRAALAELGGRMEPSLAWAWAEENRIVVAGTRNGRGFGSELATLFGMGGPLDTGALAHFLGSGAPGDSAP